MKVKTAQAISMVQKYLRAGLVPMIHGSPGLGKSAIIKFVARVFNLKVIDVRLAQCDPTDLNGFPRVAGNKASYLPMDTFPLMGDELPVERDAQGNITHQYAGWLIFFDEANSAAKAVQAAAYKIVLDRMIGQHFLHERAVMALAGNLENDGAVVEPMSTALQSRLAHIELETGDTRSFLDWAAQAQLDRRIPAYIGYRPENLYAFKPDHTDLTYACNRTWEFADKVLKVTDDNDPDRLPMLAGVISEGVALEFNTYCKVFRDLPQLEDILRNPDHIQVPTEPSVLWALSSDMAHNLTVQNAAPLLTYMGRLPIEFQIISMRAAKYRNPELAKKSPPFQKWLLEQANELY